MLAKLIKPFHFKIFFSSKYVHAQVLDKVTNVTVASICSNNRAFEHFLGLKACKNDDQACELAAKLLAQKVRERQVPSIYWDGIIHQKSNRRKYLSQVDALWSTLEDEGLQLHRDDPPSQKEIEDRRREAKLARKGLLDRESRVDPRFRQQMWKLMKRKPRSTPATAEQA